MFNGYKDFYELYPEQAAQIDGLQPQAPTGEYPLPAVHDAPGAYVYRVEGGLVTGVFYGPWVTDAGAPAFNFLTNAYEFPTTGAQVDALVQYIDEWARENIKNEARLPEWSANYPDGHYEGFADLAAESGWVACAECGVWADHTTLIEVDGEWYHVQHDPRLTAEEREWAQELVNFYGDPIYVEPEDAPEVDEEGDPIAPRVNELAEWENATRRLLAYLETTDRADPLGE